MPRHGYESPFSNRPGLREAPPSFSSVSIVVPFYNEEECVEFVLREIIACQPNAEVVAVDDGSKDRTWEILQSVPGVTPLRLTANRGQSGALFAGLRFASGDILVYTTTANGVWTGSATALTGWNEKYKVMQ